MAASLRLFELCGDDPVRLFSPYCWRIRMALAHKGLEAQTIPWRFTEKDAIKAHNSEKVPVLLHGDEAVADSWTIANYLEDKYPDKPSLFGGTGGRAMARMLNSWGDLMAGSMASFIITDIYGQLGPVDQAYFRESREKRFGKKLEDVTADRDARIEAWRKTIEPLRITLRAQPFLGGDKPNYADYIVFGPFQWARATSPFKFLKDDDPVFAWRDKMLDAFGGMARKSPGYAL
jgi:glutathione S-transferase